MKAGEAGSILMEAMAAVEGPRGSTHGNMKHQHECLAEMWNVYIKYNSLKTGSPTLTAPDVARMMVLLKVSRSVCGSAHRDHAVDAAGYAAIAGAIEA